MLTIGSPPAFKTSAVIRSDPGALLFFSEDMAFLMAFLTFSLLLVPLLMFLYQGLCWEWIVRYFHHEEILCLDAVYNDLSRF